MSNASSLLRTLLIYSICVPLAVFLGYLMAAPTTYGTFAWLGLVLGVLSFPLFLRWHHAWLIVTWNLSAVLFFIPGRPEVWLAMTWISLLISVVHYIINRRRGFLHAPSVSRPLLFLAVVVLVTAKATGGIGLQAFGSELHGGKKYLMILTAIAGYFALASRRIPPRRALLYVTLFFLTSASQAIGELGNVVGPSMYFIFMLFPVSDAGIKTILASPGGAPGLMTRLSGLAEASMGIFCAMLARYGIREIFNWRRLGRALVFLGFVGMGMLGGFRSTLILFLLAFMILFYLEGMWRSRMLPFMVLGAIVGVTLLTAFVDRLPLTIQRSMSFLPLPVDPIARQSAEDTARWRWEMWKEVLPQIPEHLILGKGFGFTAAEAQVTQIGTRFDEAGLGGLQGTELVGDYHNGPITVILPFGIFGAISFLWFILAGLRVLHRNYQYGPPAYRQMNRFILAWYFTKTIFFFTIFGGIQSDLMMFTGLVGLSISLNGGVARPILVRQPRVRLVPFKLRPAVQRPVVA